MARVDPKLLLGAAAVLAAAVGLYAHAWADGRLPVSHPWAGLVMPLAAGNLALHAFRVGPPDWRHFVLATALLASGGGLLVTAGI